VGIAQLAEHRTVAPAVAGSIPVSHPIPPGARLGPVSPKTCASSASAPAPERVFVWKVRMSIWLFAMFLLLPAIPFWVVYFAYTRVIFAKLKDAQGLLAADKTFDLYKRVFGYSIRKAASESLEARRAAIKLMFRRYYRTSTYVASLGLLTVICVGFIACGLASLLVSCKVSVPLWSNVLAIIEAIPRAALAGFWGAYLWALHEIVLRYRDHDFTPTSAHFIWVRFLASSLVAGFFSISMPSRVPAGVVLLTAFCIGSLFPNELLGWTQNKARQALRIEREVRQAEPPTLHLLQGATPAVISRLSEVGIESIHHLAYADPFSLLFQTNFRWTMILDFIDQALLFNYLRNDVSKLYSSGIRGAIELSVLTEGYEDGGEAASRAEQVIEQLAAQVQMHETQMRNLVECVDEDYQVRLLADLFADAFGE
jgi:hypothetical protein